MAEILVVDDDVDVVAMNRAVLEGRGHKVTAAYSAAEAREILAVDRPDLVVLDVMMESVSAGFDLARELSDTHPGMPIVMLSGVREAAGLPFEFKPDAEWLPVLKFLEKSTPPEVLADEVDAILKEANR